MNKMCPYFNKKLIITWLLLCSAFFAGPSTGQPITINGTVTGIPNNNFITGVKVVAIRADNNSRLDSAFTNANGYYNMVFIWTGTQNQETHEEKLFPNPYSDKTQIIANLKQEGIYKFLITGPEGKTLLNTSIALQPGFTSITLSGGQSGVHIISLSNNNGIKTYKGIQTESTGSPITYMTTSTGTSGPTLKSTLDEILTIGDEVRLEFTYSNTNPKNSYNPKDTTFIITPDQTIDQQMQQQAYLFTTTLKPVLDNGAPVTSLAPGWTTTFEFPAPVGTKTYTPNENNEIIIQEELFPLNGELGNVTISHDTTAYFVNGTMNGVLSWIVLRTQNQSTAVRNPGQSGGDFMNPDPSLTLSLDSLDGRVLNYYTLQKKAEGQPGVWFRMDEAVIAGFMASSGAGAVSGKHIDLPDYAADSLILILDEIHFTNGIPISASNLDRADAQTDKILGLYTNMQNNDNIAPKTARHRSQPGEPAWNKVQNRGYVNSIIFYFDQTSPVNSRSWKSDYTYDGELRLDFCTASYAESTTNGQIFSENYSAITGIIEGSGSLGVFVYTSTGDPTQLAGCMARWVKILDLGSGGID